MNNMHENATTGSGIRVEPMDTHNETLVNHVHPADWVNPEPQPKYNLVVIGGGTAGLVTAIVAAGLGAKVALIERHLMGGDCLNVGCVPSKALISAARVAAAARDTERFGVRVAGDVETDFAAVMERMRRLRADIAHNDSAARFRDAGVDVFLGNGAFSGPNTIDVGGKTLRFAKACIATGARAAALPIEGLKEAGYLDNETVFTLTERPQRLAVLGSGPIGCELAQTFQRFGSDVTVIDVAPQIMPREDPDAAAIVRRSMEGDGVRFVLNAKTTRVTSENGEKVLTYDVDGASHTLRTDEILVGVGRKPNVDGLNLEAANVAYDAAKGVTVNDYLQTTNPNVYAAGDICMAWKFTHAADFAAQIVIQNALFSVGPLGKKKLSSLTMPWCTYTEPEVAHVGLYESEAAAKGLAVDTFTQELKDVDRAIVEGDDEGFVKVLVKQGTDEILGATIVARNAGDLISEVTLAMTNGLGLGAIVKTIHPYPTQAEAIRKAAILRSKTRVTATAKKLLVRWMALRR